MVIVLSRSTYYIFVYFFELVTDNDFKDINLIVIYVLELILNAVIYLQLVQSD